MRIAKASLVALMWGVLTVGCMGDGSGEKRPSADISVSPDTGSADVGGSAGEPAATGDELPVEVTEADADLIDYQTLRDLMPDPADHVPLTEDVLHTLRRETVSAAGVWDETSGKCEGGQLAPGDSAECVVRYGEAEARWWVSVDDGPGIYSYTYRPESVVIRAQAVRGHFWRSFNGWRTVQRCDEMPDVSVAPVGDYGRHHDTGHRCRYLDEHAADGDPTWRDYSVVVGDSGDVGFLPIG